MGSMLSTMIFQPLLLGTAMTLMIVALIYQKKSSKCGDNTDNWGSEVFKLDMGIAIVIIITAVIINFISGMEI
jgi:hypothetical protein